MFCKFCGNVLQKEDVFCGECGKRVLSMPENNVPVNNLNHQNVRGDISSLNPNEPRLILCDICKQHISSQAEICPHCGHKTKYGESVERTKEKNHAENNIQWIVVINAILGIVGIVMLFISLSAVTGDLRVHRYTYAPPLTDHELHNLYMLGFAVVMIGASIGIDIGVMIRRKKQNR